MSKAFFLFSIFALLLNAQKIQEDSSTYTLKTFKQNGVIKEIRIPNSNYRSNPNRYGLILKFSDESRLNIASFERKYAIKLKKKLTIGYYIFENNSALNDYDLIENIIENEPNLHTIKHNTPLNPKIM